MLLLLLVSAIKLKHHMLHKALCSNTLQCICVAIEMARNWATFVRHRRFFLAAVIIAKDHGMVLWINREVD